MKIPYQHIEIEQIYSQVFTTPKRAIAICSANSGEGVTSLVIALAQRHLMTGHTILVVDLNLYRPGLKNMLDITDNSQDLGITNNSQDLGITNNSQENSSILSVPQLVTTKQKNQLAISGIKAPLLHEVNIKLRQPGVLEKYIEEWLKNYDSVIIDTSPLNRINAQNIPPERIAAACDGAVLIVLAGQTHEAMICSAVKKLNSTKAQLLGCVINDFKNPSLKTELLREVQRIRKFKWLRNRLTKLITNFQLLNLDV